MVMCVPALARVREEMIVTTMTPDTDSDSAGFRAPVTTGNMILVATRGDVRGIADSQGNTYVCATSSLRLRNWLRHPISSFLRWRRKDRVFVAMNVSGGPTTVTVTGPGAQLEEVHEVTTPGGVE